MSEYLVITIMADDRPGLIETLSEMVSKNEGNWLESRMARMAGKFAGIVHVQVAAKQTESLRQSLESLNQDNWKIAVESCHAESEAENASEYILSIVGNDRPGIVKDVSKTLAAQGVNVLELTTNCESAAMSADMLFKTHAIIKLPQNVDADQLRTHLENISNDLMVDLQKK